MGRSQGRLESKVLSLLGIKNSENPAEAFETIVRALGTASKALRSRGVDAVINESDFSPLKSMKHLTRTELQSLNEFVKKTEASLTHDDILNNQIGVQRLIDPSARKRFAAYYTKPTGLELMAQIATNYIGENRSPIVLADPFLGSGLTITETLKRLDSSMVRMVWGVEPHPLAALVAYCSILYFLNGDRRKINVSLGDTFQKVHDETSGSASRLVGCEDSETKGADVILTNPPFTRWELLERSHRGFLRELIESLGYGKYLGRKQLNLQLVSLFLIDHLLRRNGLLVSVLPASTFYTLYGVAAKTMLVEKYQIHAFVECNTDTSFSMGSGLKEVVLLATKKEPDQQKETAFITMESRDTKRNQQIEEIINGAGSDDHNINWVDLTQKSALSETNWSIFFGKAKLREILTQLFSRAKEQETFGLWSDVYGKDSIMRGVEMYGPDFFFIPNRYWSIAKESTDSVMVQDSQQKTGLIMPRDYLVPALRKPALHRDKIKPIITHYLLSIPPEPVRHLEEDVGRYIDWSIRKLTAQPAIKAFGELWYSHVHRQIRVKKPYGRVFLPDKVDPTFRNRGFFASYSQTPLVASKNFHIASLNDESKDKVLATWFNSTVFVAYFIVAGRKITRTWSRLLEDDYLRTPIINVNRLSKHGSTELQQAFESIAEMELPPIKVQLNLKYRRRIDQNLLQVMGIEKPENILDKLYSLLEPNLS
jgi:type I restriction-modification system DNA methylase subunit